jgi:flagellin
MAITVRTNTAVNQGLTDLSKTSRALSRSFERISSGQRVARAADDAAGLGVAENLRSAAASGEVAARNTNDGISVISIAEGATNEVGNILVRMRELAVQSSSETLGTTERAYAVTEYDSLVSEIDRIANTTEFNGIKLTDGATSSLDVQVGINGTSNDRITVNMADLTSATLGVAAGDITAGSASSAQGILTNIDSAIDTLNGYRADFGSSENRLNSALNNMETFVETTKAAESNIRDADFGKETAQLAQNQILQQAGVSILSQAKQVSQGAMGLLQ